jgi:hypothetical protein
MSDEEARQQVERTDAFIGAFRELIASTAVDPSSPCEAACYRGLERIAATVDAVDYVTYANLANLNAASLAGFWTWLRCSSSASAAARHWTFRTRRSS